MFQQVSWTTHIEHLGDKHVGNYVCTWYVCFGPQATAFPTTFLEAFSRSALEKSLLLASEFDLP
jgi:hypothetical protein